MNSEFILEICANSVESGIMAQKGGAQRIELCDNIWEGGTTPSYGSMKLAREKLQIKIHVIIRPRGGDFLYSEDEFEIMKSDILITKELGIDGVVFGLLKPDGNIDVERTKELVDLAKPMSVTFHRAFDVCKDPFRALEDIISCGCDRILTSGQREKAIDGVNLIKSLIEKANQRIVIMPGSGVNESNTEKLYQQTGAKEFHASLREKIESKMEFRKPEVPMGSIPQIGDYEIVVTDSNRVKSLINKLKNLNKDK